MNNAQIQSQDSNLELFEFIKSGSFKDLRKETSLIFTIKQTQTSQKNIVRKLICKNEECKVKAKIIQMELKRRSEESGAILQFPKLPIISNELLILAQFLSQRFDEYFETFDGNFFLKDKYPLCSIYNKKTGKFKQKLRTLALKVKENESEYGKKFLDFTKNLQQMKLKLFRMVK